MTKWSEYGRKESWPTMTEYPGIYFEGHTDTTQIRHDNRCDSRNSKYLPDTDNKRSTLS